MLALEGQILVYPGLLVLLWCRLILLAVAVTTLPQELHALHIDVVAVAGLPTLGLVSAAAKTTFQVGNYPHIAR